MATRIHNNVISGRIDCQTKGKITGELIIEGLDVPIKLELEGLPNPDLAGLQLHFRNPEPTIPLSQDLHPLQQGRSGDITASRKHPLLDVPIEDAWELGINGLHVPQRIANILYLEWFSEQNGRVVLEIAEAELEIGGPATWQMTQDEILGQQQDMLHSLEDFSDLLADSLEEDPPDPNDEDDDDAYPF
ncbi:hypothetical protein P3T73_06575 [Kiritimatiellota bacterium B12222]|nr:hypothetical protein P3T73_06575 [Kiritimatiellota bacterium B12222]